MIKPQRRVMRLRLEALLLAGVGLLLSTVGSSSEKGSERPSTTLTIVDLDGSRTPFSLQDLEKAGQTVENECVCVGEVVGFIGIFDYGGVRLTDLLSRTKAAREASIYERRNMYIVCRGTDEYQVVASWCELTQTPGGRRALVAIAKDGARLSADEGQFRLVFPTDKYVGRSVKWLETVEIRSALVGK